MAIASSKTIEKYDSELNGLHGGAKQAFKKVAEGIILLGQCGYCGGDLVYYTDSEKQNLFSYYCIGDGIDKICNNNFIRDVRNPLGRDFFPDNANPLVTVYQIQREIKQYIITDEDLKQEPSPLVATKEPDVIVNLKDEKNGI